MASTPTATRRMTYAEWEELPEETGGLRHELIDGVHVVSPPPTPPHDALTVLSTVEFVNHVRSNGLGRVFGSHVGVRLFDDVVVIPDTFFVRRDRLGIVGPKVVEGAPDLVVEILFPSTRSYDQSEKLALYERAGFPETWFIDPINRLVIVNVLEDGRYRASVYRPGDIVHPTVLPGLAIDVAALFAEAA